MPIKLSDIEVDIEIIEYEEELDLYICTICQVETDYDENSHPISHTLDICLKRLVNRNIGEPRI